MPARHEIAMERTIKENPTKVPAMMGGYSSLHRASQGGSDGGCREHVATRHMSWKTTTHTASTSRVGAGEADTTTNTTCPECNVETPRRDVGSS